MDPEENQAGSTCQEARGAQVGQALQTGGTRAPQPATVHHPKGPPATWSTPSRTCVEAQVEARHEEGSLLALRRQVRQVGGGEALLQAREGHAGQVNAVHAGCWLVAHHGENKRSCTPQTGGDMTRACTYAKQYYTQHVCGRASAVCRSLHCNSLSMRAASASVQRSLTRLSMNTALPAARQSLAICIVGGSRGAACDVEVGGKRPGQRAGCRIPQQSPNGS